MTRLCPEAFPLLSGSAWRKMHTDKAEPYSSHSFLERQYTSHDLRVERSMALPLSLVKPPEDFSGESLREGYPFLREAIHKTNIDFMFREFHQRPTARCVGLRVADSHIGNHPEDGFMPLETIRRLLVVIGRRSYSGFEWEAFEPDRRRLGQYPTTVRVFDDPILFLAGLKPSWEFGQQRPAIIVSGKEMDFRNFIYTADDNDLSFLPKEPSPRFGTDSPSASVNTELSKDAEEPEGGSSSSPVKRKLAFGSSSSCDVRAKTSASKDDAPILSISDDDEGKFPVHLVLSEVIKKMSGEADVIKARERSREEECEELRVKCELAMADFDQNHKAKLEAVEASVCREVEELKQDMRDVVSKVVAAMNEPFDLSKDKGYRSLYKNEDTQANNDFSTATFSWLDEFVADAATLIEALLSKNPPTLQKPAPSRTQTPVPSS
uniref:Uncharacterized protein n=1 Tax=Tanacetum cinerariifolium TaxID=118510 RepID=A0A6L2KC76_TANCI|nr:hypothetical protein [Tanacetum cinerariifolium]